MIASKAHITTDNHRLLEAYVLWGEQREERKV